MYLHQIQTGTITADRIYTGTMHLDTRGIMQSIYEEGVEKMLASGPPEDPPYGQPDPTSDKHSAFDEKPIVKQLCVKTCFPTAVSVGQISIYRFDSTDYSLSVNASGNLVIYKKDRFGNDRVHRTYNSNYWMEFWTEEVEVD